MKSIRTVQFFALVMVASLAHGKTDQQLAHAHLLELDLAGLTQASQPDWQVPRAMARSDRGDVYVHKSLGEVDGGYSLAAVYVWHDDAWQPAGWRMMHPSVAEDWSGESVLQDAEQLPGERFARNPAPSEEPGIASENYCTDAPDTHEPDGVGGHQVGDQASYSWTNPFQGCSYETDYEVQVLPNGSIGWVVVDFRFELQSHDDGEDEGDNEGY